MNSQTDANGFPIVGATPTASSGVDQNGFQIVGGGSSPSPRPFSSSSPAFDENGFAVVGSPDSSSPENGQPESHLYEDPNQPWYKRAWDFANTPLTESLFGLPENRQGAGGFERGLEHIASGLTSPLSLALTAATFGGGGLLESAGVTALKETGEFAAEEIPQIVKASQAALQAQKDLKPIEPVITDALKAKGGDELVKLVNDAKLKLGPIDLSNKFGEEAVQKQLTASGFSEDQIKQLSDASQTIRKATQDFSPVEDAVKQAGVDPTLWKRAQAALYNNGMTEQDLLGGDAIDRGAFQIIRKAVPDLPIATSLRAAKTAKTLLTTGFTLQQLQVASQMSPRFLDALKEGDYDAAKEYGTEMFVGAGLGILGTSHALNSAGELFKPILENTKFRPNDEWLAIDRANKEREASQVVAEQHGISIDKLGRQLLGHESPRPILGDTPEVANQKKLELASVLHHVVTGGDKGKAAEWFNALSEAAGRDERLPLSPIVFHGTPISFEGPPRTDGLGAHFTPDRSLAERFSAGSSGRELGNVIEARLGINNPLRIEDHGFPHSSAMSTIPDLVKQGVIPQELMGTEDELAKRLNDRQTEIYGGPEGLQGLSKQEIKDKLFSSFQQAQNEELEKVKSYLQSKGYDGLVYKNNLEGSGEDTYVAFNQSQIRPLNGQLDEQIKSNVFKNHSKDYQNLVLNSLRRVANGELSDKELAASKYLGEQQAKNFEIGSANDLLYSHIEDYMTRVYQDTNPQGNVILSDAKQGKLSTNVSMARQRVYDSNLTALLKSPKEMFLDPVQITAQGRTSLIKAAANRQLIDTLRDKFPRGSDGRPAVVLSGQGQMVSGQNGEDPRMYFDPNRVRRINIADPVVDQLTKSGDLQRFLDDGTIRDITPYVNPGNIGTAIDRLEDQAGRTNAKYDEVGNNKLRTQIMYLKSMLGNKDFSGLKDFNDGLKKLYAWDPQDYISLDNNAMKGWNFVTNSADGAPVFVRSDVRVHPEFAEYLQNRLGLEKSAIASNPIGKALLGAGTKLKQTLLSLSPFHLAQEALRGIMTGINPFHITGPDVLNGQKIDPSDPYSPTILRKAVEHGATLGTDYKALQEHSEGVSAGGGIIKSVPLIGKTLSNALDWYQDFLFKRYIPALKSRAIELLYRQYESAHPDWSVDRVAKAAGTHANETFGGINWRAMGRAATSQDWGRLLLLAPDWLESEMRSGARLFNKDEGGIGRAQVAKMALGLWGVSRVLNLVTTGNPHYEAPFGLAVKNKEGKETVFGIRTLPTDLLSAASDPVRFIKGRLSPTFRGLDELSEGRDQYGRKLAPEDLWADVFRNMAPIPVQSAGQAMSGSGPEVGNIGQTWKSVGGTAQTYSTPAQKFAADLASSHSEDGPLDPVAQARHRQVLRIEDQVRAGELSWPDLYKLTYQTDQLRESELKKIQDNVKSTQGKTPDIALLYSRASRLPATQYLQMLDLANPSEKAALIPLTIKTQKRYLTKAKKEETPEERSKDPVFQKFIRMIPGSAPGPQSYIPPAVQREAAYLYTATHAQTGHRVGSNDGQNWYDNQTGAPVNG
jgi:hypothetical protein